MKQYLDLCDKVVSSGFWKENRTGVPCLTVHDEMLKFDLQEGFPAVTTKELQYSSVVAELIGFISGFISAEDFRNAGTHIWDANANENQTWLENPNREGQDHLGPIYGWQWRHWGGYEDIRKGIDQLRKVITKLTYRVDNRRLIVSAWNVSELNQMALPPCHMMYQFHIRDRYLDMAMYQRSCDLPLGVPFNIASYATLLSIVSRFTHLEPGVLTIFMGDVHIYRNQLDLMYEQLKREPKKLPSLYISPTVQSLDSFDKGEVRVQDFNLINYYHHPKINYPFTV